MIKSLLVFGLTRSAIIVLGVLVFCAAGIVAFSKLNIEAYPNPAPVILEITCVETVARRLITIDLDVEVRLAHQMEDAEVGDARDLGHFRHDLRREFLQRLEICADDLDRVGALHTRQRLFDVVLDVLGEIESDPGQFFPEVLLQIFRQLLLGEIRRPLLERFQGREQFDIGERRGIAAVVRSTML